MARALLGPFFVDRINALAGEVRSTDVASGPADTLSSFSIVLGTTGGVTINAAAR